MLAATRAVINRDNARHSTGPKGERGKQIASLNGFKHGLTGQRMILQDHELHAYRRLGDALQADYNPATEIERQLVQHIVDCHMRLNRIAAIDANLLNIDLAGGTVTETVISQTRAWIQHADSYDKLGRYEARISRQLLHYTRELAAIQATRRSQVTDCKENNMELASFRKNDRAAYAAGGETCIATASAPVKAPGSVPDTISRDYSPHHS